MEPRYGMIYQRRSEAVRPSCLLKLKSNPIGLNKNIIREYVWLVLLFLWVV